MQTYIPRLKDTVLDLIRCLSLPDPQNPESFVLDKIPSFEEREAVFFELNRFMDHLYYDQDTQQIALDNTEGKEYSKEFMECIHLFNVLINKFISVNDLDICDYKPSENLTEEENETISQNFKSLCETIKNELIKPIFKNNYQIAHQFEVLTTEPEDLVTYDSRMPFSEEMKDQNSLLERTFNKIGLFFKARKARRKPRNTRKVREHQLHVLDAHGKRNSRLTEDHDIDVELEGGDIVLASCQQNTNKAQSLLSELSKPTATHSSGVIHTQYAERNYVLRGPTGALITSETRYHNYSPQRPNPFVRTTLERTNQDFKNRSYTTNTGQRFRLERSNSGQRLYLGTEENYFTNRFKILAKAHEKNMALFKKDSETPHVFECNINFQRLENMNLTEKEISLLNKLLATEKNFRWFYKRTKDKKRNELKIRSIVVLLKNYSKKRMSNEAEIIKKIDTLNKNIDFLEDLLTTVANKETLLNRQCKESLESIINYINSNAFIQNWANQEYPEDYEKPSTNLLVFSKEQLDNIRNVATVEDYQNIEKLHFAIDNFLTDTYRDNPPHINSLIRDIQKDLSQKMNLMRQGKLTPSQQPKVCR